MVSGRVYSDSIVKHAVNAYYNIQPTVPLVIELWLQIRFINLPVSGKIPPGLWLGLCDRSLINLYYTGFTNLIWLLFLQEYAGRLACWIVRGIFHAGCTVAQLGEIWIAFCLCSLYIVSFVGFLAELSGKCG